MEKQRYLFRHQFTGVVKAYKAMTSAQAETANACLVQEAGDCRWYFDPLPTAIPLFGDFQELPGRSRGGR